MKEKKEIDRSIFWNIGQTLTHNALFNIIVGNRGGGKSYGAKKRGVDNWIKNKEQFGYIRRYKEDLKKPLEQFFEDIKWEYPDFQFKVVGEKLYCRLKPADPEEKWTDDDICGYGFVLSTANNKKSMSFRNLSVKYLIESVVLFELIASNTSLSCNSLSKSPTPLKGTLLSLGDSSYIGI